MARKFDSQTICNLLYIADDLHQAYEEGYADGQRDRWINVNCAYCSCCNVDMGYCQVTGKDCFDNDYDYHRPDWCPLEEVDDD